MNRVLICILVLSVAAVNCKSTSLTDRLKDARSEIKDALTDAGNYIRDGLKDLADSENKRLDKLVHKVHSYHGCKTGVPEDVAEEAETLIEAYKNFTAVLKLRRKQFLDVAELELNSYIE